MYAMGERIKCDNICEGCLPWEALRSREGDQVTTRIDEQQDQSFTWPATAGCIGSQVRIHSS